MSSRVDYFSILFGRNHISGEHLRDDGIGVLLDGVDFLGLAAGLFKGCNGRSDQRAAPGSHHHQHAGEHTGR